MKNPYVDQPTDRHPSLGVRSKEPLNAETPLELLAESLLTPNEIFYIRNHLPVPMRLSDDTYTLRVGGDGLKSRRLSLGDLKKRFKQHTIVATIQCTGNRRKDLMDSPSPKEIKGLKWEGSAIGTATWTGVLLRDVLIAAGIDESDPNIRHIRFEGHDEDITGSTYGASIPVSKAMDPRGDVLLAFEMNGKELSRDHGYPLRVLVPGVAACRSVKWLKSIEAASSRAAQASWRHPSARQARSEPGWCALDALPCPMPASSTSAGRRTASPLNPSSTTPQTLALTRCWRSSTRTSISRPGPLVLTFPQEESPHEDDL